MKRVFNSLLIFQTVFHIVIQLLFIAPLARAGSDHDFAGSGGGSPEDNTIYAYHHLYKFIDDYIELCPSPLCHLNSQELSDLIKIKKTSFEYSLKRDHIVLCATSVKRNKNATNDECPIDWKTSEDDKPRTFIALRGKIFANVDQFYSDDGKIQILFPEIAGLLVHEFGHLAHISDHRQLSILNGKLREYIERKPFEIEFPFISGLLSLYVFNFYASPIHSTDLVLNIGPSQTLLTPIIYNRMESFVSRSSELSTACPQSQDTVLKYEIRNLSWRLSDALIKTLQAQRSATINLQGTLRLSCYGFSASHRGAKKLYETLFHDFSVNLPLVFDRNGTPRVNEESISVHF